MYEENMRFDIKPEIDLAYVNFLNAADQLDQLRSTGRYYSLYSRNPTVELRKEFELTVAAFNEDPNFTSDQAQAFLARIKLWTEAHQAFLELSATYRDIKPIIDKSDHDTVRRVTTQYVTHLHDFTFGDLDQHRHEYMKTVVELFKIRSREFSKYLQG